MLRERAALAEFLLRCSLFLTVLSGVQFYIYTSVTPSLYNFERLAYTCQSNYWGEFKLYNLIFNLRLSKDYTSERLNKIFVQKGLK